MMDDSQDEPDSRGLQIRAEPSIAGPSQTCRAESPGETSGGTTTEYDADSKMFEQTGMTTNFRISHVSSVVGEGDAPVSSSPGHHTLRFHSNKDVSSSESDEQTAAEDVSIETGYISPDRHYQRNEVAVDPKTSVWSDGSTPVCPDAMDSDSTDSLVIAEEAAWSRPSSAGGSCADSGVESSASPVSGVFFPSAVEVLSQPSPGHMSNTGVQQEAVKQEQHGGDHAESSGVVHPGSWQDVVDNTQIYPPDSQADAFLQDWCGYNYAGWNAGPSDVPESGVGHMIADDPQNSYTSACQRDAPVQQSVHQWPGPQHTSMSNLPEPFFSDAPPPLLPEKATGIVPREALSRKQQEAYMTMFGGVPNISVHESLRLLEQHVEKLRAQLAEHAARLALTTDPQHRFLMRQQQAHLLEAQRLLVRNQQLMLAQLSAAPHRFARCADPVQPQPVYSSREQYQRTSSLQQSCPNIAQQLARPPLSAFAPQPSHFDGSQALQPQSFQSVAAAPTAGGRHLSPLYECAESEIKHEASCPLSGAQANWSVSSESSAPPPPSSRSVVSPGQQNMGKDVAGYFLKPDLPPAPPPQPAPLPPAPPAPSKPGNMSCLRDILARPPKIMPPSINLITGPPLEQQTLPFQREPTSAPANFQNYDQGFLAPGSRLAEPTHGGSVDFSGAALAMPVTQSDVLSDLGPKRTDDNYAVRYATTPLKRRRRRPLGESKKPYARECLQCGEVFHKPDDYKEHLNQVHAGAFKVRA